MALDSARSKYQKYFLGGKGVGLQPYRHPVLLSWNLRVHVFNMFVILWTNDILMDLASGVDKQF